jgi:membrane-associated phospholipid phosphatase
MQKLKYIFPLALIMLPIAFFLKQAPWIHKIDVALAYFFNDLIRNLTFLQNPCAFLNAKIGNWLYDVVIVLFTIPYILFGKKEKMLERFINTVLIVALCVSCYFFFNRYLVMKFQYTSFSPSGVLPDLFKLSSVISWTKVKEFSANSYPSDHGSTIFMFVFCTFILMGRKKGIWALLFSIPFALPRLLVGAHWTSDLLLGSLPLAAFNIAWFFFTPIYQFFLQTILRSLHGLNNIRKKLQTAL